MARFTYRTHGPTTFPTPQLPKVGTDRAGLVRGRDRDLHPREGNHVRRVRVDVLPGDD